MTDYDGLGDGFPGSGRDERVIHRRRSHGRHRGNAAGGQVPVVPGIISVDRGDFVFTGSVAALVQAKILSVGAGSFAFAGQDVGLITVAKRLAPDPGVFLFGGDVMSPVVDHIIPAGAASFLFTGSAMTPTKSTSFITLNSFDKNSDIVLSSGDLGSARNTGFTSFFSGVRGTGSRSSGKFYFEVTIGTTNTNRIGISIGGTSLTGSVDPTTSNNSVVFSENGSCACNGGLGNADGFTLGDTVGIAYDLTAQLFWMRNVTNLNRWNADTALNQNPVGNIGGFNAATMNAGNWFPTLWYLIDTTAVPSVCNFGATAFAAAAPSGYGVP